MSLKLTAFLDRPGDAIINGRATPIMSPSFQIQNMQQAISHVCTIFSFLGSRTLHLHTILSRKRRPEFSRAVAEKIPEPSHSSPQRLLSWTTIPRAQIVPTSPIRSSDRGFATIDESKSKTTGSGALRLRSVSAVVTTIQSQGLLSALPPPQKR